MKILYDLHTHTRYSDGRSSVEDNIKRAKELGLEKLAITDHGHGKWTSKKIKPKFYKQAKDEIKKYSAQYGLLCLFGIEANVIGMDGEIDITKGELKELDILLCGVHRKVCPKNLKTLLCFFLPNWLGIKSKKQIERNTRTVINVLEKNKIDILTHPGRYFPVDIMAIAKKCAEVGTLFELGRKEIPFSPQQFNEMQKIEGLQFIINSDAHGAEKIGQIKKVEEFLKLCEYKKEKIINLAD
ncbi:MAG: PHP domain-containing protein [Christensenellaceae bacterium]|jgi:putative hydrolase|nr:PHP domain-containing protein [Christensenellaceae bacterium]